MAKQIFVNSKTGEEKEFEVDANGRPIFNPSTTSTSGSNPTTKQTSSDPILRQSEDKPAGIRPMTMADRIFNLPYIGTRHVVPTLEALGGELGAKGIKVPYAGRALGYGLGYGAGANLRTIAPLVLWELQERKQHDYLVEWD